MNSLHPEAVLCRKKTKEKKKGSVVFYEDMDLWDSNTAVHTPLILFMFAPGEVIQCPTSVSYGI